MGDGVADLHVVLDAIGVERPATPPPDLGSVARTHVYVLDDLVVKCDDRFGSNSMQRERCALELLEGTGLPVPAVVTSGRFDDGRQWIVTERLDGAPPPDAAEMAHRVSVPLATEMGALAAQLHRAVRPPGFGTWERERNRTLVEEERGRIRTLLGMARDEALIDAGAIDELEALAGRTIEALGSWRTPVLAHRDIQPRNVLVVDGRLSALVDFESAAGGDPAEDFKVIGLDWTSPSFAGFCAGYRDAGGRLGDDARDRLAHHVLNWALAIFAYLGRIAPRYLEPATVAVERIRAGERPVCP